MKLFINYRRADEGVFVELLRTHFMNRYGRENVFMDFDSIPHFTRFADFIKFKIAESDVIVVMIGPRWLETIREREASGEPDFVRIEIVEALRLNKPIAPIAIQGARVPDPKTVPADLRPLFDLNTAEIKQGRDLLNNIDGLMASLDALAEDDGIVPPAAPIPVARPAAVAKPPALDALMGRFAAALNANDLPLALLVLEEMRVRGGVPDFFQLDQRTAELQQRLRAAEEAQRRREVADYLYGVVLTMVALKDPPDRIRAALQEVWKVEAGYDPKKIAATLPVAALPAAAPVQKPTPTPAPKPIPHPQMRELRPLNPFDWVRLYMWLFFQPDKLLDHRKFFNNSVTLDHTGIWLSSTLVLLPLFIPTLAATFGTIPWRSELNIFPSASGALVAVVALWIITGLLSFLGWEPEGFIVWVIFGVASGVAVVVAGGVAVVVAFGVAFGVAGGVAVVVAVVVAGGVALGVAFGVVGGGVGGIVAGVVAFVVAFVVADVVEDRLKSGKRTPSGWQVLLGLVAPVCYAVLIAVCFFGVQLP